MTAEHRATRHVLDLATEAQSTGRVREDFRVIDLGDDLAVVPHAVDHSLAPLGKHFTQWLANSAFIHHETDGRKRLARDSRHHRNHDLLHVEVGGWGCDGSLEDRFNEGEHGNQG